MNNPSNISHPLKNYTGTSQRTRVIESLHPDAAPIDGKTLADRLHLIGEYARHIKYYGYAKDPVMGEYQELGNWSDFFKNSLPFQLANLSKTSLDDLNDQFLLLSAELKANPSKQSLESVLVFILNKLIVPNGDLYEAVDQEGNSFTVPLLGFLKSSFLESLRSFIALYNASVTYLCTGKKNFSDYRQIPWQLGVDEIYALDADIKNVTKGKKKAYQIAAEKLDVIFHQMFSGMQDVVASAADYIPESLLPLETSLQKKHRPHLGLLFTFLELFKHVQGDINKLGKKHLDFFYEQVLKLIPKNAVADKAHIVFEVTKHLNEYPLPKDLLLKDGKDLNKQEIQFGLEHEIILDKAQVKEVRTLSLYPAESVTEHYIEGAYIAPVANTQDGVGRAFEKGLSANWPTLGSKYSKHILEGNTIAQEHPRARLGFVLASPVLLLQEGKRTIDITLTCDWAIEDPDPDPCKPTMPPVPEAQKKKKIEQEKSEKLDEIVNHLKVQDSITVYTLNSQVIKECDDTLSIAAKNYLSRLLIKADPYILDEKQWNDLFTVKDPVSCVAIFTERDQGNLRECVKANDLIATVKRSLFNVLFSGEKEWLEPKPENITITVSKSAGLLNFDISIVLEPDLPSVVFYDGEVLKEKIDVKDPFPLVKITINDAMDITVDRDSVTDLCCLKKQESDSGPITVSAYNFLQKLILVNAKIDVTVCGVKNLIVQNDDNLQDVNKTIMPFGPRPKIDSSFIIGSKEVFCKNWQSFRLGLEWKDRPTDFNEYYEAYNQDPPPTIINNSFEIEASVLENGNWKTNAVKKLFLPKDTFPNCPDISLAFNYNGYRWNRGDFAAMGYRPKSMPADPLTPLDVNSRKAFFRVLLKGEDFQHDRYAFVLAQQMFKLAKVADLIKVQAFINKIKENHRLAHDNEAIIDLLEAAMNGAGGAGGTITVPMVQQVFGINHPFPIPDEDGLNRISNDLHALSLELQNEVEDIAEGNEVPVLPNEPYTPLIKSLSIDYEATADTADMEIVHLHAFENTSKHEEIEQKPSLFPFYDDEGTLFIGLEELTPGSNLALLFQLAEATADSESDRAKTEWHYLSNNNWVLLRPDFEVISDETDGLTVSGIVTLAIPDTITTTGNTVMPDNLYWIKVSVPEHAKAVAETLGIHTQAARVSARFGELSDRNRLETGLPPGSIAKLVNGDFSVKKVEQPYASFDGRKPESEGHFYIRVSEHLKHKGRAVMGNDYEKIVLEGFPNIYKVKCVTHTMGISANSYRRDLEVAPGYAVVTVIPDLTKLKSGNMLQPKAPVSLLEKIGEHLRKKTSPFARIKVMNPRYEAVNVNITVRLYRGKSKNFYSKKLKDDITDFLAPWLLGDSEKLAFGQVILFSDVVGFTEQLDYVDYILDLALHGECGQTGDIIKPLTARSVLVGGEICVTIGEEECEKEEKCLPQKLREPEPRPEPEPQPVPVGPL